MVSFVFYGSRDMSNGMTLWMEREESKGLNEDRWVEVSIQYLGRIWKRGNWNRLKAKQDILKQDVDQITTCAS